MGKKEFKGLDSEPALSNYGITETIKLAEKEKDKNKSIRFLVPDAPIAVSPLIRTWETAVLLYGYKLYEEQKGNTHLKLRICPWLRETGSWTAYFGKFANRGNRPKELEHSIRKFIKFLNSVIAKNEMYMTNTITIYAPAEIQTKESLPSMGTDDVRHWQLIQIYLVDGEYKLVQDLCGITDSIYGQFGYQTEVGDIMKFMEWYTGVFGIPVFPSTVHIVAHSQIMQNFAEDYVNIDLDSDRGKAKLERLNPGINKNVTSQNCWSMTMTYRSSYNENQQNSIIKSIQNGYDKPKNKNELKALNQAQQTERNMGVESLCSDAGSVGDLNCPPKRGGRRTRRKRSNRKKTHRNRRYRR